MNQTANPRITVIFAYQETPEREGEPEFPGQGLPEGALQVIPVAEDNFCAPHQNALAALMQAEGEHTILLDEGDLFDNSMLRCAMEGLAETKTAFVMPGAKFQMVTRSTEYYMLAAEEDRVIDAGGLPDVFPTDLHGLLIPTASLKKALAKTLQLPEPEKQTLLCLLQDNPKFLYLGTNPLKYALARECDHQYDNRCRTHEWYYDPFEKFLLPLLADDGAFPRIRGLLQLMALHMIHIRIVANTNNRNKGLIPPEDVMDYAELFSRVLQYIDTRAILCRTCNPITCTLSLRQHDIQLKKHDFSYRFGITFENSEPMLTCDGLPFCGLLEINAQISLIDYRKGCLEIDGAISDLYHDKDVTVFARFDGKSYDLAYNGRFSLTKCFGVAYSKMKTFHVSIPVPDSDKPRILQFVLRTGGREFVMDYAFPAHTSRFSRDFPSMLWQFGPYASYWDSKGIHVVKSTPALVLTKQVKLWGHMWARRMGHRRQIPLKILNFLLRPYFSRQKIWLFFDKIYKGGDSSEYMYRYAAKQKDGIKKYYLLDRESADYARMRREGYRPLVRGSIRHRLIFLNANMVIASNSTVFAFNDYTFRRTLPFRSDVHFDVACVQHGMSIQKIALAQQRLRDNTKLYFCASKYEIENLSKPVYDYAGYDALKLTGVPRYDGLENRAQKIILLSPTWRMNSALPVFKNEGVARDYNPNFRETSYYKVYNGLINDPRLLAAAEQYGYRIQYVLHPIVSPQYEDFTQNDRVEIISAIGDMSYEKLFCEAALMVTDFSGVQFDFAYMRKPVVYLHHNDIPQHYEEGTFHYKTMGFGEICHTNDELIDVLCEYMKRDCAMPQKYRARADDFFAFSDHKNRERIYPIMLEHERNRDAV